jgi:predicted MFS family arabinose efflux permease
MVDGGIARRDARLSYLLFAVAAADLATYSAIVPLLPRYERRLGLSSLEVGLVVAAYAVAVLAVSIPAGRASDRVGKRTLTVASVAAMAGATVVFVFASSFPALVGARFLQGAASGIAWSAGLAWLSETSPPGERAASVARMTAGASAGLVAGPMIGGVLGHVVGIRSAFLIIAAASLATAIGLLTVPEEKRTGGSTASFRQSVRRGARDARIRLGLVLVCAVAMAGGGLQTLVPLHLGREGVSAFAIGLVYAGSAGLAAVTGFVVSRITARMDLAIAAGVAAAILAATVAALAFPLPVAGVAVVTLAQGSLTTILYVSGFTFSAEGADSAQLGQGLVMGVVNLGWGGAAFLGPVVAGGLGETAGEEVAFLALALLVTAALAAVVAWHHPPTSGSSREAARAGEGRRASEPIA